MGRITFHLADGSRGILHAARGYVPGSFFVDTWRRFMARHAERVQAVDYWLSDYEGLDPRDIRPQDVERLVEITAGGLREDEVIGSHAPGDLGFGMTRMWHLRSEYSDADWRLTISRDRDALLRWIGEQLGRPIEAAPGELLLEATWEGGPPQSSP
jgi:hypothetical protein